MSTAVVAVIVRESLTELYGSTRVELELVDQFAQSLLDPARLSNSDSIVTAILSQNSYDSG